MNRTQVDILIHGAAQLVTCASSGPKRGPAMRDVGIIANGSVAITDGRIVAIGGDDLHGRYDSDNVIDAAGKVVCPGLIDPHTHVVYGGDRIHEFELRMAGASYLEILAGGGGILHTMRETRAASTDELVAAATRRLRTMLRHGTTTVEVKTGYGLDTATELKMLRVIEQLDHALPLDLVPTFLGAHTVPPEWKHDADGYVDLVIGEMLPVVAVWWRTARFKARPQLAVDVFCEQHAFSPQQCDHVLRAARSHGFAVRAHVDQFNRLGAAQIALAHNALSIDHLDASDHADVQALAASATIGVGLPMVNVHLGNTRLEHLRTLIDNGAAVALATDDNPGSAPCLSLPLVMALACRFGRLLPAEALNAVTINAAHALALGDAIGSLEAGKQADLLILDVDDYRVLAYEFGALPVEQVIKRGRVLDIQRDKEWGRQAAGL